jgi:hypothetical protein
VQVLQSCLLIRQPLMLEWVIRVGFGMPVDVRLAGIFRHG